MQGKEGFTLVELVVVMAIIAVLATLALPAWTGYLAKARRMDATSALQQLRLQQEAWRGSDADYATLAELGWSRPVTPDGHYALRLVVRTAANFRILAVPMPGGAQQGDACGTYAIDQDGPLMTAPFAGPDCWQR